MLLDRQSGIVCIALNEPGICRILIQGSPQACFKCAIWYHSMWLKECEISW